MLQSIENPSLARPAHLYGPSIFSNTMLQRADDGDGDKKPPPPPEDDEEPPMTGPTEA